MCVCVVEEDGERKETLRSRKIMPAKNSLWTPVCFSLLQKGTGRHSPSLSLCGPQFQVIPKQSALIQSMRSREHSAARLPERTHPGLY